MALMTIVARLALATLFAVAGTAKLVDRAGTRNAMRSFGAPKRLVGLLALLIPLAELAVAALLLPSQTAVVGAGGALGLLAIFTVAIALTIARGRAPECHCFGQLHSAPASWKTVGRNGAFAALAVIVLVGSVAEPAPSAVAWIGDLEPAGVAALVAAGVALSLLVVGGFALTSLMRSYGHVLVRLDRLEAALAEAGIATSAEETNGIGLEPGTPAPWFLAPTPEGGGISRDDLLAPGVPVLLLFTSPHCGPCTDLLPDVSRWQHEHAGELTVAVACAGPADAVGAEATEFHLVGALVDESAAIASSFEVAGTPAAVLIASDGTIASWMAAGRDEIEALLGHALAPAGGDSGLPIGTTVPSLELPSLDGETVALEELRGRDTVLLFWNPGCGFCGEMHEELVAWEQTANGATPRLVVVSSGDVEATRAEGFRSTVLLDPEYAAGTAFGAGGTPMAVLVGADGRVASNVVAGAEAVLELARRPARAEPAALRR